MISDLGLSFVDPEEHYLRLVAWNKGSSVALLRLAAYSEEVQRGIACEAPEE